MEGNEGVVILMRVAFVMNFVKALVIAVLTSMNCEYLFPTQFKIKYILYRCFSSFRISSNNNHFKINPSKTFFSHDSLAIFNFSF